MHHLANPCLLSRAISETESSWLCIFWQKLTSVCQCTADIGAAQAGDKNDVGEGRGSTFSTEAGTTSWTNEGLSSYLVCVVEGTAESGPQGSVDIGIVAIETSTGDVLHAQFRSGPSPVLFLAFWSMAALQDTLLLF